MRCTDGRLIKSLNGLQCFGEYHWKMKDSQSHVQSDTLLESILKGQTNYVDTFEAAAKNVYISLLNR